MLPQYLDIEELHIPVTMVRSKRKTLALSVTEDAGLLIKAPLSMSEKGIRNFVTQRRYWIYKTVKRQMEANKKKVVRTESEEQALREQARIVLTEKTRYYASHMGVTYTKIRIGDQKTLWGSRSSSGTISYNWRLILMPEEIQDYVVVHELCHCVHMNHSDVFWNLLISILPDGMKRERWLKKHGEEYR